MAQQLLSRAELEALVRADSAPCVSIYLPTHRSASQSEEDRIRFKNLVRRAEDWLMREGRRRPEAEAILEPAAELLRNDTFWTHGLSDGLAVFAGREFFRAYPLPQSFSEVMSVSRRFHLKPLVHLFAEDHRFLVLAVSQQSVRLYQATRGGMSAITLPEKMPRSMQEAIAGTEFEPSRQHHRSAPAAVPGFMSATGPGVTHGHALKDMEKKLLQEYFHAIARHLDPLLATEHSPLVLATVEYYAPMLRPSLQYKYVLEEIVNGSPGEFRDSELFERAWKVVEPHFREGRRQAAERYGAARAKGRGSNELAAVVVAAHDGRVETLFAPLDADVWGGYDPEQRVCDVHEKQQPGDCDLISLAVEQTLIGGGKAFVVKSDELPDRPVAAIYRF